MAQVPRLAAPKARRRALVGMGIGLVAALLLQVLRGTETFEQVEAATVDARTRMTMGQRAPDDRIVIAEIMETDIDRMSREFGINWPWTEDILQYIPPALANAGAKGFVIDMLHLDRGRDPSELDPETASEQEAYLAAQLEQCGGYRDALQAYGPVALGFALSPDPRYDGPLRRSAARERLPLQLSGSAGVPGRKSEGADWPVAVLIPGARYVGFVNTIEDSDGIVRRGAPIARLASLDGRGVPSLSLTAAALLVDGDVRIGDDGHSVHVGDAVQALDHEHSFLVRFPAPADQAYALIDPVALIEAGVAFAEEGTPVPEELAASIRGKLVIWGANILANEDLVASPIVEVGHMHGPAFQAFVIDNLLHGDGRLRIAPGWNAALLFFLCIGLGGLSGLIRSRSLLFALLGLGILLYLLAAYGAFAWFGRAIDVFTPLLGMGLTALGSNAYRLLTEGMRNRWLEGTFSRYLAPDVIAALKDDPSRLQLGGRRREITIFFSDVAGFTSISERLQAEAVVRLLNRYLTAQSAELMEQGGVIDKFEGDAIMAFFGDPLDMEDHATRACRAAVRCVAALDELETTWRELGLEDFRIRIGMNTGEAIVGNMGSDRRFDYTCMGDAVNLAARLEGANKHFGSVIMIGPQTYEQAAEAIVAKPLGDLVVVGKKEPVAVYELVAMRDDVSDAIGGHAQAYECAYRAIRAGDVAAAREALGEAESLVPGDPATAWLVGVLGDLEQDANRSAWDGRVVLHSK